MLTDYARLRSYRQALADAPHLADLKTICRDFCQGIGLDYYLLSVCEVVSLVAPRIVTLTNYPALWVDQYFQNRSASVDPMLRYSLSNTAPVLWSELAGLEGYNGPADLVFRETARNAGLVCGLTVPLNPPSGQRSCLSLASSRTDLGEDSLGNLLPEAGMFGQYLVDAYLRIDRVDNPKVNELTERELECVFWACEGKTAWEMAHIVGVTERTVNFHLTSVIKKLGAANRQHAVAKAVMYGLVKPRP